MQAPRTIRSMLAPACAARISAWISTGSVSALILTTMRAGVRLAAPAGDALDELPSHAPVQRERRLQQRTQRPRLAQAGELLEHRIGVGRQLGVGGEVATSVYSRAVLGL